MLHNLLDVVLHLDTYLAAWSASMGSALYGVLFLVIFCETGLVVTPFLPGDSLLFAIGALAAIPESGIDIIVVILLLIVAAVLGDTVNYKVGQLIGERAFAGEFRFISQKHLLRTKAFFERYGRRAVVFARFAPIFRTFAPFVAGFGRMPYSRFLASNVGGGVVWVTLFCGAGYRFGNIPAVKNKFHLVIIAIIVISLIPAVIGALRANSDDPSAAA
jgi:membrane-associated protein